MRNLIILLAVAAVSACAKSPDSITPAYVSERLYDGFDCAQLAEEQANLQAALAVASQQQSDARTNDIVGVVLLGLPVSTLSGGNVAYQVADLKGHVRAVQQSMVRNRCSSSAARAALQPGFQPAAARPAARNAAQPAAVQPAFHDRVAAAVETADAPATVPAADGPAGLRPMPSGPGIAEPVNYSAEEILSHCRAGWDTRQLSDGTVEYNPCYYE